MKLQQLRYIWEVAHHDLNVSVTAQSLYTSQPGISKQIRLLEDELGVEVFSRSGKHLTRVTPAGKKIIEIAGEILRQVNSVKQVAQEFSNEKKGILSIATTHNQARYALPKVIQNFMKEYPEVCLDMHQGTVAQSVELVADGVVDFLVATDIQNISGDLVVMPCYQSSRCLLVPASHTLAYKRNPLTLQEIAKHAIVACIPDSSGRSRLDDDFMREGVLPKIVLSAADADVIKTYVRLGTGIGIIGSMAHDPEQDKDLVAIDISHLFEPCVTFIGFQKGAFLRGYMYQFMNQFAPHLTKELVNEAIACHNKTGMGALFADITLPCR